MNERAADRRRLVEQAFLALTHAAETRRVLESTPCVEPDACAGLHACFSLPAAERELARVHQIEQALLLRCASRWSSARTPLGSVYLPAAAGDEHAEAAWRVRCSEELASARRDGFASDPALVRCQRTPISAWPGPMELARAALALESCDAGRACLARAELAEGALDAAIEGLRALCEQCVAARVRAAAQELLALALEAGGELHAAARAFARAAASSRSVLDPVVGALAAALACGDASGVDSACARLSRFDLASRGNRRRLQAAIARLRQRVEHQRALGRSRRCASTLGLERRVLDSGARAALEVLRALF